MIVRKWLQNGSISTGLLISVIVAAIYLVDNYYTQSNFAFLLIISGITSYFLTKLFIPLLESYKLRQIIRKEGPQSHYKKSGTVTMGGFPVIISALLISNIINFFYIKDTNIYGISLITLGYMLIGVIDDFKSLLTKKNSGLSPKNKIILQLILATIFLIWANTNNLLNPTINLPFNLQLDSGAFIFPIAVFIFIAESNATNLTDGLDGLASGCSSLVFIGLALEQILKGNEIFLGITIFNIIMAGCWLGFLVHNKNPAKVFMGDTGSLAIGGALTAIALLSNSLWSLLIMGGVFFIESISVIIQVSFFKATKKLKGKGERIFLMTPLHHHYEIKGINENLIVMGFWATTIGFISITLLFN